LLNGAETLTIAGNYVFVAAIRDWSLNFNEPLKPRAVANLLSIKKALSLRFSSVTHSVTDVEGFKIVDVTDPVPLKWWRTNQSQQLIMFMSRELTHTWPRAQKAHYFLT